MPQQRAAAVPAALPQPGEAVAVAALRALLQRREAAAVPRAPVLAALPLREPERPQAVLPAPAEPDGLLQAREAVRVPLPALEPGVPLQERVQAGVAPALPLRVPVPVAAPLRAWVGQAVRPAVR